MIVRGQLERIGAKLDECSTCVWNQWSKQATQVQIFRASVENRKKSRDNFYKMNQESIITMSEWFYAMAHVQINGVWKLPVQFEDNQVQVTLELGAYERERRKKVLGICPSNGRKIWLFEKPS